MQLVLQQPTATIHKLPAAFALLRVKSVALILQDTLIYLSSKWRVVFDYV